MAEVITRFKVESTQYEKKIKDAKKGMDDFSKSGGGLKNILGSIEKSLGVNISSLAKFGSAIGALSAAMKVAKDAFNQNESCVDEFGRTMKATEGIYSSFVSSLNNASLSSFFGNIDQIVSKAREAYDALDDLATKGGIISNKEARLNYLKSVQMAIIDNASSTSQQVKEAQEELKRLNEMSRDAKKATSDLNAKVVETKINELLTNSGFKQGTDAFKEAFDKVMQGLYDENFKMGSVNTGFVGGMKINNGKTVRYTDNGNRNLDNIVTDKWRESVNPYVLAQWSALQSSEDATRRSNKFANKGASSSGSSSSTKGIKDSALARTADSIDTAKGLEEADNIILKMFEDSTKLNGSLADAFAEGSLASLTEELKAAQQAMNECVIGSKEWEEAMEWVNNVEGKIGLTKEGNNAAQAWQAAGTAIHGVGSALTSIDNPIAKVMGLVAQAIASVASGAGQAMAAKDTTSSGWAWIGAAAAITAEMTAIIATIKSATQYHAAGGFVSASGLSRGTDTVPAMLTPGELVLNKSQQSNLASHLSGGFANSMNLSATLRGEDLILAINNTGRRRRNGEYIQSR